MDESEKLQKFSRIGQAFSPSAPIDRKTLFAGRVDQLKDAITTVTQRGQHAVIFGERGVGKTSLANIILQVFGDQLNKPACGPINCDGTMSFSDIWHKVLREMHTSNGTLDDLVSDAVTPDDVRHVLQDIKSTIVVLDEVDRIRDKKITEQLADTIKNISDHSIDTTIILVGVADSVDALIEEHISIERNLVQIRMPRMSDDDLTEIIDKGCAFASMQITLDAKTRIAKLAQGLPHYAHRLCLHSFQDAVDGDSLTVDVQNVKRGISKSLQQTQQSIVSAYQRAVTSPRKDNLYRQVLLACAMAKTDALGYFYAGDIRAPMTGIMKKTYDIPAFSQHLNSFCESSRGTILIRTGTKRKYRFRFSNPLMQPYVIMNGVDTNLVSEDQLFH